MLAALAIHEHIDDCWDSLSGLVFLGFLLSGSLPLGGFSCLPQGLSLCLHGNYSLAASFSGVVLCILFPKAHEMSFEVAPEGGSTAVFYSQICARMKMKCLALEPLITFFSLI